MAIVANFATTASAQTPFVQYISSVTVVETGGLTAEVKVHDSADNTGTDIFRKKLAAGESVYADFAHPKGLTKRACYVEIVSGTVEVLVSGR